MLVSVSKVIDREWIGGTILGISQMHNLWAQSED
jgi:hypothetical protein